MPAAAVIPAPIAYIKVVAVKTFVGDSLGEAGARFSVFWRSSILGRSRVAIDLVAR